MTFPRKTDPFVDIVLNRIDPEIRKSLTPEQIDAISSAVSENNPFKKQRIDMRGAFSLFFARFYFVFLIGRDISIVTRFMELERRQRSLNLGWYLPVVVIATFLFVLFVYLLYLLKSALGIDLFPDKHLRDFLGFGTQ